MSPVRTALLVGAHRYNDPRLRRLRAPSQDVEALANVLADEKIGRFDVHTLVDRPMLETSLEIERFFAKRKVDDLLILYFSCHGLKDDYGDFYFATVDTQLDWLGATALAS